MAPEKENPRAHMAMSALARALDKTKKACIIRFVPRANQAVFVGCATPLLGDKDKPDCLVLNYLPFTGMVFFPWTVHTTRVTGTCRAGVALMVTLRIARCQIRA